jgi:uncharacterized membrane protein (DUF373 family)
MEQQRQSALDPARRQIVHALTLVEDGVYIGLGILLSLGALALLVSAFKTAVYSLWKHDLLPQVVGLLDQILLVLLIIELLYTVQVSFKEHGLVAEPFLVVALIAVVRRILVITAELAHLPESSEAVFWHSIWELSLLTAMILVLVGSFIVLQKYGKGHGASQ